MWFGVSRFYRLCTLWVLLIPPLSAAPSGLPAPNDRIQGLLDSLRADELVADGNPDQLHLAGPGLRISQCSGYPYNEDADPAKAGRILVADLKAGLQTGLRCLAGLGPEGRLHSYHEYQADRLLTLFESTRTKTFQCVEDAMFATAVATSPRGTTSDDPLYQQLGKVSHPAVVLDTFRLGGILSKRLDDETYRSFFHLEEAQILEHLNGQPLRPANLHRYQDRPGLIFHELVHWLGHQHSGIYPDLAHLYETCCFGGSDYISDPARNSDHQQTACGILKDDELWSQSYSPYKQMRLWHYKGYDRFKTRMRADYDS